MRVFVTGATGFIGRRLSLRLAQDGHDVVAWVRDVDRARATLGAQPELVDMSEGDEALRHSLEGCDAVINLAGSPVARRWSAKVRRSIVDSRVGLTRRLVGGMEACSKPPRILLSASAVGYYGDRGTESLTEQLPAGEGFLAEVCRDWESAALRARDFGCRVALMRIGVALGAEGGALATMVPAFSWGLGAILGSGRQYMPFIHVDDVVELFVRALVDRRFEGPFNAVAPHPVDNAEFSRALGGTLGRPVWMRVPSWALKIAFGGAAQVMLASQRAICGRAQQLGFRFRHPTVRDALESALRPSNKVQVGPVTDSEASSQVPEHPYLKARGPSHRVQSSVLLDAPIDEVFDFFRQAENLGVMTPPDMKFDILTPTPIQMRAGTEIAYRISVGRVPMRWFTSIELWEPPSRFADAQMRGPYAGWFHEHRFERVGERTKMTDRVWYRLPLGPVGRLVHRLFVRRQLERIFEYRVRAIALRFGLVDEDVAKAA